MERAKSKEEEPEVTLGPHAGTAGEPTLRSCPIELDSPARGIKEEAAGDANSIDLTYPDPCDSYPGGLFPGPASFNWSSPESSGEGRNHAGGGSGQEGYEDRASRPGNSRIPGKDHRRYYHSHWRLEYLMDFNPRSHSMICMVCGSSLATLKLSTIKRHIRQKHPYSLCWTPIEKEVIIGSWDAHLCVDAQGLTGDEDPEADGMQVTTGPKKKRRRLPPVTKGTWCSVLGPERPQPSPPNKRQLEQYMNESLQQLFRLEFLMDYDYQNNKLHCMMCTSALTSLSLNDIKHHILDTHPTSLQFSPTQKSMILEAWINRKETLEEIDLEDEMDDEEEEDAEEDLSRSDLNEEEDLAMETVNKTKLEKVLNRHVGEFSVENMGDVMNLVEEPIKNSETILVEEESVNVARALHMFEREKLRTRDAQLLEKKKVSKALLFDEEEHKDKEKQLLKENKLISREQQLLLEEQKAMHLQFLAEQRKIRAAALLEKEQEVREALLYEKQRAVNALLLEEETWNVREVHPLEKKKAREAQLLQEEKIAGKALPLDEKRTGEALPLDEKKALKAQLLEEEKKKPVEGQLHEEEKKIPDVQLLGEEKKKKHQEVQLMGEEKNKKPLDAQLLGEENKKKHLEAQLMGEEKKKPPEAQLQEEETTALVAQLLEVENKKAPKARLLEKEKPQALEVLLDDKLKAKEVQLLVEEAKVSEVKRLAEETLKPNEYKGVHEMSQEKQSVKDNNDKQVKSEVKDSKEVQTEKRGLGEPTYQKVLEEVKKRASLPEKCVLQVQQAPTVLGIGVPVLKMETQPPIIIARVSVIPERTVVQLPKPSTSAADISKTWRVIAPKFSPAEPTVRKSPTSTDSSLFPAGVEPMVWEVSLWRGNNTISLHRNPYNTYQMRWRAEFLMDYNGLRGSVVCMYCCSSLTVLKESSIKRHIVQKHPHTANYSTEEKAAVMNEWEYKLSEAKNLMAKQNMDGVLGDQILDAIKVSNADTVEDHEEECNWSGVLAEGKGASWEFAFGRLQGNINDPRKYQHDRWKLEYLMDYTPAKDGLICMVCGVILLNPKISTVKMHIQQKHPDTTYLSDQEKAVVMEEWEQKNSAGKRGAGHPAQEDEICIEINEDSTTSAANGASAGTCSPHSEIILPTASKTPKSAPSLPPPCNSAKRNYQVRWRTEFMMDYDCRRQGLICMVCGGTLATLKVSTIKRHIVQVHPYSVDFTAEERQRILEAYSEMALHYIHSEECFKTQPREEVKGRKRKAAAVGEA